MALNSIFKNRLEMANEIKTPERSEYIFTQAPEDTFTFKLRAPREAQIALSSKPSETEPIFEVILGSSNNQKSLIRRNFEEVLVQVDTPDILKAGQLQSFWITWKDNIISVGREDESDSFISYTATDDEFFPIYFIGIRVGDDARGTWQIDSARKGSGPGFWLSASDGTVPQFAVPGGYNGETLYIARALHAGNLLPGCLVPSKGSCFVSCDGAEHKYAKYEVFCNSGGHWEAASGQEIPENAVRGGKTSDGEPLYMGRVQHEDANGVAITSVGKVQVTHECCYIPHEGQELAFAEYEIFVWEPFSIMEFIR